MKMTTLTALTGGFLLAAGVANAQAPTPASADYAAWKQSLVPAAAQATTDTPPPAEGPNTANICTRTAYIDPDETYSVLPANDDQSTGLITLPFDFTLYGTTYNAMYVNNNGNITFNNPLFNFTAEGFPIATPMVAPFWADVDTRGPNNGLVYYKVFDNYAIITWDSVGYFSQQTDKLNSFQVIISNGTDTLIPGTGNVDFRYKDMQWTTGSASQGSNGFGGVPATVGLNSGNNTDFVQIGRFGTDGGFYDGPGGGADGIDYLDCRTINLSSFPANNIPPSASLTPGQVVVLDEGETTTVTVEFAGPELTELVTTSVNTSGLCGVTVNQQDSPTAGAPALVTLTITGQACNVGTNTITVTGTDNGVPAPDASTVDIIVSVVAVCNAPTGLGASSTTNTSATLTWNAATNAQSYTLRYRAVGATDWITQNNVSNTSLTIGGLDEGTAYEAQVRTNCAQGQQTDFSASATFTTAGGTVSTWAGTLSTDYATAGNWSGGTAPAFGNDVVIPGGAPNMPVLTGFASINDLTLAAGASLTVNGFLVVNGDIDNDGTLPCSEGTVTLGGGSPQSIGGSGTTKFNFLNVSNPTGVTLNTQTAICRLLTLAEGQLNTNGNLLLESNATASAMVALGSGNTAGSATVQRYVSPSNFAGAGYRHFATPLASGTLGQALADEGVSFNANWPNGGTFPNIFAYQEDNLTADNGYDFNAGWAGVGSNAPFVPGRSYTVNIAPTTMDASGPLQSGNVAVSLSRAASGDNSTAAGWNMVGNPYPAPIDWNLVDRTNVDAAAYIFRPTSEFGGNYVALVNGVGSSNFIPTMQGFFVRVSEGQTSGSITFQDADRLTSYANPAFLRGEASDDERPRLQLTLTGPEGLTDELIVYAEAGASYAYDGEYDAFQLQANADGYPTLGSLTAAGRWLTIDGISPEALSGGSVLLRLLGGQQGAHSLALSKTTHLPAGTTVHSEDLQTGQRHDLRAGSYDLALAAGEASERYRLVLGSELTTALPGAAAGRVAVYPNPTRDELRVSGLPSGATLTLYDALGRVALSERTSRGSAAQLAVAHLPTGVYLLAVRTSAGVSHTRVVVE